MAAESVPTDRLTADAAAFLEQLAASGAPRITGGTPASARALNTAFARKFGHRNDIDGVVAEDLTIPAEHGEVAARLYRGSARPGLALVVFFHGGGWVIGDIDSHDPLCRLLARDAEVDVLSVDYRLAPEHPFPAGLSDADTAVAWAETQLAQGRPLIVAGDSAGGNLAAVLAQRARNDGLPRIALQILLYPVLDTDFDTESYRRFGTGSMLSRQDMRWFLDHYVPDTDHRSHPEVAPLRAPELSGAAPALIVVGGCDALHDEALAYAARLREAGVPVRLHVAPGQVHGFLSIPRAIPSTVPATEQVIGLIAESVADVLIEELTDHVPN